jgi:hypothetical protein
VGDNTVTLIGSGLGVNDDVDVVTVCGYPATIITQTATAVEVVVPFGPPAGLCAVVVQSVSLGNTRRGQAYRYNVGMRVLSFVLV